MSLGQHPFLLGLFLRGAKSNEIHQLLATVQQKLFFDGVVRPLLKESEARMAALNWETFSDYPAFFGALQSFLGWRGFDQALKKADGTDAFRAEDLRLLNLVNFAQKTKGMVGSEFAAEIDEWAAQITPADPRPDLFVTQLARGPRRRGPEARRSRPEPSHRHVRALLDRREPRALGLEAHEGPRGMGPALHGAHRHRGPAGGELPQARRRHGEAVQGELRRADEAPRDGAPRREGLPGRDPRPVAALPERVLRAAPHGRAARRARARVRRSRPPPATAAGAAPPPLPALPPPSLPGATIAPDVPPRGADARSTRRGSRSSSGASRSIPRTSAPRRAASRSSSTRSRRPGRRSSRTGPFS